MFSIVNLEVILIFVFLVRVDHVDVRTRYAGYAAARSAASCKEPSLFYQKTRDPSDTIKNVIFFFLELLSHDPRESSSNPIITVYSVCILQRCYRHVTNIEKILSRQVHKQLHFIFSNFNIALTQFATILVISCSCVRAFPKLPVVKFKLKSITLQERFDSLI